MKRKKKPPMISHPAHPLPRKSTSQSGKPHHWPPAIHPGENRSHHRDEPLPPPEAKFRGARNRPLAGPLAAHPGNFWRREKPPSSAGNEQKNSRAPEKDGKSSKTPVSVLCLRNKEILSTTSPAMSPRFWCFGYDNAVKTCGDR